MHSWYCIVIEVLLYYPDLKFDDDGIKPPVMEFVVSTLVIVSIIAHEPSIVFPKPPLVVPESIFDFVY